ncbi:hypothetical protein LZ554_004424 [Drepanopeziza brunnea f. sp. 'monogermtubi']|nr:hypothetical protein LZ554_004424 [Drepanopeziza brunnea f. sp. 'monogermtubi']
MSTRIVGPFDTFLLALEHISPTSSNEGGYRNLFLHPVAIKGHVATPKGHLAGREMTSVQARDSHQLQEKCFVKSRHGRPSQGVRNFDLEKLIRPNIFTIQIRSELLALAHTIETPYVLLWRRHGACAEILTAPLSFLNLERLPSLRPVSENPSLS